MMRSLPSFSCLCHYRRHKHQICSVGPGRSESALGQLNKLTQKKLYARSADKLATIYYTFYLAFAAWKVMGLDNQHVRVQS